ncbi:MAG TPA: CHAT domain-containing protein [Herpetosiphonaceae bacterium]|nr:CHAT domain-containing protein [Herpetosiphonaceae bacterium]
MTGGVSIPIGKNLASYEAIGVDETTYTIDGIPFKWNVKDANLLEWTQEVLKVFEPIEFAVNDKKNEQKEQGLPLVDSLTLAQSSCQKYLRRLAEWGKVAYTRFFEKDARDLLQELLADRPGVAAPTFRSKLTPFPWELLYEGDDDEEGDPGMFWGLHYAPARMLGSPIITRYESEQAPVARMLFCLHQKLRESHQREWPHIQSLVRVCEDDQLELLGASELLAQVTDGKALLGHLYTAQHNMIHFACHADEADAGKDVLRMSLLKQEDLERAVDADFSATEIRLDTNTFARREGLFANKPLVFLNACKTGGGGDVLREAYNLPRSFVDCQAGAVIATACPVPDIFAAEFARVFYGYFLRGFDMLDPQPSQTSLGPLSIGEALRLTRWYFIKKHNNPLGLAYGLYSPAHYRVALAPRIGSLLL